MVPNKPCQTCSKGHKSVNSESKFRNKLLDPVSKTLCLKTLMFALIFYLQPTDVPQHVIDEKKLNITSNKEKEESSNKSNSLSLQHVEQLQQEAQEKEQQEQLV